MKLKLFTAAWSTLSAAFSIPAASGIPLTQYQGVHAGGNSAGGGGERSGAEGRLGVAGDGGPWMTGTRADGGEDFGLFNQDGGAHGGAIRGLGQFDGQAIHSDGGRGNIAFGSVGTKGDAGGEVVAGIGTNVQDVMMPPRVEGKDGKDDSLLGNEVNGYVADGEMLDASSDHHSDSEGGDGSFGSGTKDAKPSNEKARNDISIMSIPEDGMKYHNQISRSLQSNGFEDFVGTDIGAVGVPGSAIENADGSWTVQGSGYDIWYTGDEFFYLNVPNVGNEDTNIEMRIDSFGSDSGLHEWAKGGLMIRDTLEPDSAYYSLYMTGSHGLANQWRAPLVSLSASSMWDDSILAVPLPVWLKIKKLGNQFSAAYKYGFAQDWIPFGSPTTINFPSNDFFVGIAVTSHDNDKSATLEASELGIYKDGPWDINFLDLSANFSVNSNEELVLNYEIGNGHQFDTLLFLKDCTTNVTDITINYTEPLLTQMNANFSTVTLGYNIDKSMIANSSIWNATSSQIELCQVFQLKEGTMVISEDIRQVTIDFDMRVDYEVNSTLGAGTTNAGNDTIDVSSYIEACKCNGVSFVCNTDALVPNSELIVCIKSVSSDVGIDFLDSMNVTQEGVQDMAVIDNANVVFSSFTSMEYVSTKDGVVVSTRVPTNVFDYNSPGGSVIGITGALVMKLAGSDGSGRNLKTNIGAKLDADEEASFEIEVTLQRELAFVGETSLNSAANIASSNGVIGSVVLLAWANAMW